MYTCVRVSFGFVMLKILVKKVCTSCKEEKSITNFHKSSGKSKDGYHSHCKQCRKARNAEFEASPKRRWNRFLNDTSRRGIEVKISFDQFKLHHLDNCYYCNQKLKQIRIDRIDSSKPYEVGNIVSACAECNYMKNSMNINNFLEKVEKIYLHQNRKLENE